MSGACRCGGGMLAWSARLVRQSLIATVVVVGLGAGIGPVGTTAAGAQPTTSPGETTVDPVGSPGSAAAEARQGPQFSGRAEPSMSQRVADSLIWGWLLIVFVGAPSVWIWAGRRSAAAAVGALGDPASSPGAPDG